MEAGASSMEAGTENVVEVPSDTAQVEPFLVLSEATKASLKRKLDEEKEKLRQEKQQIEELEKPLKKQRMADVVLDVSSDTEDSSDTRSVLPSPLTGENCEEPPVAIEVFNCLGVLGAELKKQGFAVIGIDRKGCKDKPLCRTVWIDLSTRLGQLEFWDIIRKGKVKYVHFAPPCGTASAARNIRRRFINPKPLWSLAHPEGLPDLQSTDRLRVDLANELYKFVARAIAKLDDMGISMSDANPSNSLMWSTRGFKEVADKIDDTNDSFHASWVHFGMCMHGGRRPKKTSFLFGGEIDLSTLEAKCDGSHEHLPWGLTRENGLAFVTAAECNYLQLLSRRIAKRAAIAAGTKPLPKHPVSADKAENMDAQPRRSHNELISEYKEVRTFQEVSPSAVAAIQEWQKSGKSDLTWEGVRTGKGFGLLRSVKNGKSGLSRIEVGFPWTTEEFTELAQTCKHPFDRAIKVPPAVAKAMATIAKLGPEGIARKREKTLEFGKSRKAELEAREEQLNRSWTQR